MFKTPAQFKIGDRVWFEDREEVVSNVYRATTWGTKGTRTITRRDGSAFEVRELDFDNPLEDNAFEVSWEFKFIPGHRGVQALDHISYIKDDRRFHVFESA